MSELSCPASVVPIDRCSPCLCQWILNYDFPDEYVVALRRYSKLPMLLTQVFTQSQSSGSSFRDRRKSFQNSISSVTLSRSLAYRLLENYCKIGVIIIS